MVIVFKRVCANYSTDQAVPTNAVLIIGTLCGYVSSKDPVQLLTFSTPQF